MTVADAARPSGALGVEMHALITELYPICRSITGEGFRSTLEIIGRAIPLTRHEIASGTSVLDWTIPPEWNVTDAYVKDAKGERVIDFQRSNLHLIGYSEPFHGRLSRAELDQHLFSVPEHPDWIPYRTSYYTRAWGFCVSHRVREALPEGEYDVCVDTSLEPGVLTWGECVVPGRTDEEVLISCHACHPSLCNDNLSGIAVATFLARELRQRALRYTYRILFIPGTIGAIAWLARNESRLDRIRHGLVITGVGDPGPITYKKSRSGDADVDRAMAHVLAQQRQPSTVREFTPYGYDERQYGSPGFNLPVGCLMRTPYAEYAEYHTSADDLSFVRPDALAHSLEVCVSLVTILEQNRYLLNLSPKGEPQLGKRGLYRAIGAAPDAAGQQMAMLWVLNFCDGRHSLLDIARRSSLPFSEICRAAALLETHGLLRELGAEERV